MAGAQPSFVGALSAAAHPSVERSSGKKNFLNLSTNVLRQLADSNPEEFPDSCSSEFSSLTPSATPLISVPTNSTSAISLPVALKSPDIGPSLWSSSSLGPLARSATESLLEIVLACTSSIRPVECAIIDSVEWPATDPLDLTRTSFSYSLSEDTGIVLQRTIAIARVVRSLLASHILCGDRITFLHVTGCWLIGWGPVPTPLPLEVVPTWLTCASLLNSLPKRGVLSRHLVSRKNPVGPAPCSENNDAFAAHHLLLRRRDCLSDATNTSESGGRSDHTEDSEGDLSAPSLHGADALDVHDRDVPCAHCTADACIPTLSDRGGHLAAEPLPKLCPAVHCWVSGITSTIYSAAHGRGSSNRHPVQMPRLSAFPATTLPPCRPRGLLCHLQEDDCQGVGRSLSPTGSRSLPSSQSVDRPAAETPRRIRSVNAASTPRNSAARAVAEEDGTPPVAPALRLPGTQSSPAGFYGRLVAAITSSADARAMFAPPIDTAPQRARSSNNQRPARGLSASAAFARTFVIASPSSPSSP